MGTVTPIPIALGKESSMKPLVHCTLAIAASLFALSVASPKAYAQTQAEPPTGRKDCDVLKGEIEARIRANGVAVFRLDIVTPEAAETGEGRVVGSCDGGTRRIVYQRATPAN